MIDIRDRIPSGYTGRYELNVANVEATHPNARRSTCSA